MGEDRERTVAQIGFWFGVALAMSTVAAPLAFEVSASAWRITFAIALVIIIASGAVWVHLKIARSRNDTVLIFVGACGLIAGAIAVCATAPLPHNYLAEILSQQSQTNETLKKMATQPQKVSSPHQEPQNPATTPVTAPAHQKHIPTAQEIAEAIRAQNQKDQLVPEADVLRDMSKSAFRKVALSVVDRMRRFESDYRIADDRITTHQMRCARGTSAEADACWDEDEEKRRQLRAKAGTEFTEKLIPDARAVRAELRRRLGISMSAGEFDPRDPNHSVVLDEGMLSGPSPIIDAANQIDDLIRRLH